MFKTNAEGCGFLCAKIFIRYNVRTTKSTTDSRSFIMKNRYESLEKKSNR